MAKTKIAWTSHSVNCHTGCSRLSDGCKNCYSLNQLPRMRALHPEKYSNGASVTYHPGVLEKAVARKKPTLFFVNSMSDSFHEDVEIADLRTMFEAMGQASHHTFQLLTKRAERLAELAPQLPWHPNIWQGVTVEANRYLYRVERLKTVPANVRFLSIEPLLDELTDLTPHLLEGIDWVIVGGESGQKARRMDLDWARAIQATCAVANVPFFFKQCGSAYGPHKGGELLDGKIVQNMPGKAGTPAHRPRLV